MAYDPGSRGNGDGTPRKHGAQGIEQFQRLSRLLDSQFRLPGVPFRFGLDGLIGLIPGIGDAVTGVMGLYALSIARQLGLPAGAQAKMIYNIAVDFVLGSVPLVGDLFDFAFHAHRRNWRIIERHLAKRENQAGRPS